jgi:COP9 signalosome complex subunit 6
MAVDLVDPSASDTSPHILFHPLALIAIDDHVSRSGIRRLGPIVGALLGRHNGKEVVVEQAFECGSKKLSGGKLDPSWFSRMLKLRKNHPIDNK